MPELDGKVALVTGGSRGIGAAICRELGAAGAGVAVNYARDASAAAAVCEQITAAGGAAQAVQGDVSSADGAAALVAAVESQIGPIEILVNNAGITRDDLIMRLSEEDWRDVIDTNLGGAFFTCRALSRPMLKRRSGAIVNISSIVGVRGNAGQTNYAASKAGLIGLTKALAKELGGRGIRVNAIAPGPTLTGLTRANYIEAGAREATEAMIPLGRIGQPDDLVGAVLFLASDESLWVTGSTVTVDGGYLTI
jgi:3-oxoacyl-[acyl-carrier protein] reductase